MKARKAFALTLDVIIAGLLTTALLAGIALSFRTGAQDAPEAVAVDAIARDALTVLEKTGRLDSLDSNDTVAGAVLRNYFNEVLPLGYAANITVEMYEYRTSGSCPVECRVDGSTPANSFCTCRRVQANTSAAQNSSFVAAVRRMLYVASPDERFGRAYLEVWRR